MKWTIFQNKGDCIFWGRGQLERSGSLPGGKREDSKCSCLQYYLTVFSSLQNHADFLQMFANIESSSNFLFFPPVVYYVLGNGTVQRCANLLFFFFRRDALNEQFGKTKHGQMLGCEKHFARNTEKKIEKKRAKDFGTPLVYTTRRKNE